uniref:twitching motility protein PilT n=1 Tax=Eubacterium cellulosolvens TaxID=29322 RepID=UPI0004810FAF|nr:twitching motility protein PilT [[Eubacterium] cellulosolvens]
MVQLIVGEKGKGKTKYILDKVNNTVKEAEGSIVYLDKSAKHMLELNNKIRLIDVSAYPLRNSDEFVGFICGIISQNRDIEQMYLDGFLKLSRLDENLAQIPECVSQLDAISTKYGVDFIISLSMNKDDLADDLRDKVLLAL